MLQQYREFIARRPTSSPCGWCCARRRRCRSSPKRSTARASSCSPSSTRATRSRARTLIEPLRKFGTPVGEHVGVQPYTAGSRPSIRCSPPARATTGSPTTSPSSRTGDRRHHRSRRQTLPSPAVRDLLRGARRRHHAAGPDATAYAHRDAEFVMNVHGRWETRPTTSACIRWARDFFEAAAPFATGGVYVNFMTADEEDRVRAAYGRTTSASPRRSASTTRTTSSTSTRTSSRAECSRARRIAVSARGVRRCRPPP